MATTHGRNKERDRKRKKEKITRFGKDMEKLEPRALLVDM